MGYDGKWNDGDFIITPSEPPVKGEIPKPLPDITTVALGKDQTRVTSKVEHEDKWYTTVEILEVDPGAGMNGPGLRTVRKEVVERGYRS